MAALYSYLGRSLKAILHRNLSAYTSGLPPMMQSLESRMLLSAAFIPDTGFDIHGTALPSGYEMYGTIHTSLKHSAKARQSKLVLKPRTVRRSFPPIFLLNPPRVHPLASPNFPAAPARPPACIWNSEVQTRSSGAPIPSRIPRLRH